MENNPQTTDEVKSTQVNNNEVKNIQVDNLTPTKPLPQSPQLEKTPAHLPLTELENTPKKKNIFLIWILSIITLDIYTSVWYLSKSQEFSNLGTNKKLGSALPLTLLISSILLITSIIIFPLTIDIEEMGSFYQHLSSLQTIILFAIGFFILIKIFLILLTAFYSRTIINEALKNKESKSRVSSLFTLIFTHLYLQYEINKIIEDKEDDPKIGPWAFFLIILILGALWSVFLLIK